MCSLSQLSNNMSEFTKNDRMFSVFFFVMTLETKITKGVCKMRISGIEFPAVFLLCFQLIINIYHWKKIWRKLRFCSACISTVLDLWSLSQNSFSHRVISDKVHNLFVTLSYFRTDRFVQLLSLIPILILLLYLQVSIDLVYTGIWRFMELVQRRTTVF